MNIRGILTIQISNSRFLRSKCLLFKFVPSRFLHSKFYMDPVQFLPSESGRHFTSRNYLEFLLFTIYPRLRDKN